VAKKRVGRYPKEFRWIAVERLKNCDNIVALAQELGVHRRLLYKWRDRLDPAEIPEESPPQNLRESTLRKEVNQLKRLLADKAVEADFFRGALQKVEARRAQENARKAQELLPSDIADDMQGKGAIKASAEQKLKRLENTPH
jgi:transposase-like protein